MKVSIDLSGTDLKIEAKKPKEMMSFTVDESTGKFTFYINPSSLDILKTCMKKAELSLYYNYRSNLESPATVFGSAVHSALEVWYGVPHEKRPQSITKQMTEFAKILGANPDNQDINYSECRYLQAIYNFVKTAEPLRQLSPYDKRSIESGIWLLDHYFKRYHEEDKSFVTYSDKLGPFVERRLETVLFEDDKVKIILFGTVDLVLKDLTTGQVLPTDHKTTSQLGSDFYNRIKPNSQFTAYLYLINNVISPMGEKIQTDSFMINGLQTKSIPKTDRGTPPDFARQITRRTQEDFQDFVREVHYYVTLYMQSMKSNFWPNGPTNSCASWGGCNFLEVCSVSKQMQQSVLEHKYGNPQKQKEVQNAITQ